MNVLPYILFAGFFVACITHFWFYDELVKRQYLIARAAWEADDRPPGFWWAGDGSSVMRSWPRNRVLLRWFWSTPAWVREDAEAQAL